MSAEDSSRSGGHGSPRQKIVFGTRGSELALAQMRMVEEALARSWPSLKIATEVIRTRGDHELVIPSENASPARTEGSRREIFKVTSTGSLDFARDDGFTSPASLNIALLPWPQRTRLQRR